jgi:hypothetical protein
MAVEIACVRAALLTDERDACACQNSSQMWRRMNRGSSNGRRGGSIEEE